MIAHKVALNYNNKKFKCRRSEYVSERELWLQRGKTDIQLLFCVTKSLGEKMLVFKRSTTTPECDTHKSIKLKTNATIILLLIF